MVLIACGAVWVDEREEDEEEEEEAVEKEEEGAEGLGWRGRSSSLADFTTEVDWGF